MSPANDPPVTNVTHHVEKPCPSCGHCPTCGRGGRPAVYPYQYPWVGPNGYIYYPDYTSGTTVTNVTPS